MKRMKIKIFWQKIQNTVDDLNGHIASLSGIKEFEDKLTPEYQKFHDEGISVSIKSEIAVKGLYSNIIPYIKQDNDNNLYPTAGEGRKKLLAYSIYDILSDENAEKKIQFVFNCRSLKTIFISLCRLHYHKYFLPIANTHTCL